MIAAAPPTATRDVLESAARCVASPRLQEPLDRLYREFDWAARADQDAIRFPIRYPDPGRPRDRRAARPRAWPTAGWISSGPGSTGRSPAWASRPPASSWASISAKHARALRGLPLPLQPPARSRRLLPGRPARPDPARLARRLLPRRLLPGGPARGPGPRALRRRLPRPGSLGGLPAQPALVRLPALVPAAVHRRAVQAPASLPALDGPARAAGLRPLDRRSRPPRC